MRKERTTFSEVIQFRASQGLNDAITRAAVRDHTTTSEYVRRVLVERLKELGLLGPFDSNGTGYGPRGGVAA